MTAVNELSQAEYELMQLVLKNEKSWQADVLALPERMAGGRLTKHGRRARRRAGRI